MKMLTYFTFFVIAVILGDVFSLPSPEPACLNALAPPSNARGVNKLDRKSEEPLFRLHFTPHASENGSETYRVHLTVTNELIAFSDAKISLSTYGSCGVGSLTFDPTHFFEEEQSDSCPRLLMTNRKVPMMSLPNLLWTPPSCGCVQFRALVIEGGDVYYADNENVDNGPLSNTICMDEKPSKEQYLDALCKAHDRYSVAQILSRPSFLKRHRLETRRVDRFELEMGLELRRSDNKMCCSKTSDKARSICFDDTRRRRVDRFCEDGFPDIPFTSFRLSHMRNRENSCCFILGEHRYSCFAKHSYLHNVTDKTILDFSKDETDPVNDLAEFATIKETAIIQLLSRAKFGVTIAKEDKTERRSKSFKPKTENKHSRKFSSETTMTSPFTTDHVKDPTKFSKAKSLGRGKLPAEDAKIEIPKTKMSSEERRRLEKEMKEDKANRGLSGGRSAGRRFSSRQFLDRRGSRERLGRRRGSLERPSVLLRKQTWDTLPSKGVAFQGKANRKSTGSSRLTSTERRVLARTSGQRRDDVGSLGGDFQEGFEDQGGLSVEETLSKLNKRMKRLRLKSQCCEAGALAGTQVYGKFTHTWNECGHNGDKYISMIPLVSGSTVCLEQFKKCCIEQAVSGPTMTSSEFRESEYMFLNNMERLEPTTDPSYLYRHDDDLKTSGHEVGGLQRKDPGPGHRETPEDFEEESDRRFKIMRTVDPTEEIDEDEEKDGPQRFDEADNEENADVFDGLHRNTERNGKEGLADEEIIDFDDREFAGDSNEDGENSDDILNAKLTRQELRKKNPHHSADTKQTDHPSKLHRKNSEADRLEPKASGRTSDNYDAGLLALAPSSNSRRSRTSRGKSGGRSKSRRFRPRGSRKRSSRRRASRRSSREYRRLSSKERYPIARAQFQPHYFGHQGKALDSQEMAAAHTKKFTGALDSKEMADAFVRREHKGSKVDSDVMADRSMKKTRRYSRPYYFRSRQMFW